MNLTMTAGRYLCAAEAEPVTDVHPLGKPINRPEYQPKPQPVERWVPATERGYERSTTTGAIRQKACMSAPGMYLDSGEFVPAEQINAQPADSGEVPSVDDVYVAAALADQRTGGFCAADRVIERFTHDGTANSAHVPADRRADVIAELNKLGS